MVSYTAKIQRFDEMGEKSGWTYIEVAASVAEKIKPGVKKAYRVKGMLDSYAFKGISLVPMGGGDYILPLNATIRKALKKQKGANILVKIAEDTEEKKISPELLLCLEDDPKAKKIFNEMPASHQRYYSNWIETAKTEPTRAQRIARTLLALSTGMDFGEMLRAGRKP